MKDLFDRGRHRRRASGAGFRMTRVRVLVVLAAAMFMLLVPAGGYAIHDTGAFELDGNAVTAHGLLVRLMTGIGFVTRLLVAIARPVPHGWIWRSELD